MIIHGFIGAAALLRLSLYYICFNKSDMIKLWKKFIAWRSKQPVVPFFSSWFWDYGQPKERRAGESKRVLNRTTKG